MRLLYVEPLGVTGGMGNYNAQLIRAYSRAGHAVDLLTAAPSGPSAAPESRTSRLMRFAFDTSRPRVFRALSYIAAQAGTLLRAAELKSEGVVIHFLHWPAVDYASLQLHRFMGRRIIIVAHDPFPAGGRTPTGCYRRSHRLADVVVVHGPKAREDVLRLGVSPGRIVVAPHGDFQPIAGLAPDDAARRLGIEKPPRRPLALIVGNLKPGKGIARAVAALADPDSPIRTLLVAGKKQGTWDLAAALQMPPHSGLVLIRRDQRMSDEEELAAYSIADVVLALYEQGYSSGVIARAHALGRPVILTDIGDLTTQSNSRDVVLPASYRAADLRAAIRLALEDGGASSQVRTEDPWDAHVKAVSAALKAGRPQAAG